MDHSMKDLFGATITDIRTLIYQLFFPSGYQTLLSGVILTHSLFILYCFFHILHEKLIIKRDLEVKQLIRIYLGCVLFGTFIPIGGGWLIIYFLVKIYRIIRNLFESEALDEIKIKVVSILLKLFFGLFGIVIIIAIFLVIPVGAYVLFYFMQNYFWLFIGIGADLALVHYAIESKISRKLPIWFASETTVKEISKKVATASLLVPIVFGTIFLSCWYYVPVSTPLDSQLGPVGTNEIKIVTYNIRNGRADDGLDSWSYRREYFIDQIADFDMDIIGLQEAFLFQIRDIMDGLRGRKPNRKYAWTGFGRDDGVHAGEHSNIIYDSDKFRLMDDYTFWYNDDYRLPEYGYEDYFSAKRICSWTRFEIRENKTQFYVFCTHYGGGSSFSIPASNLLMQRVNAIAGEMPAFVIGDFNFNSSHDAYDIVTADPQLHLLDAYTKANGPGPHLIDTTNSFDPDRDKRSNKIDFIFVTDEITPTWCEVNQDTYIKDSVERCYSDHYPVIANCTF